MVELHEESAASVSDGMHGDLHVVGSAADGGDAFEDDTKFLDAITNFFV